MSNTLSHIPSHNEDLINKLEAIHFQLICFFKKLPEDSALSLIIESLEKPDFFHDDLSQIQKTLENIQYYCDRFWGREDKRSVEVRVILDQLQEGLQKIPTQSVKQSSFSRRKFISGALPLIAAGVTGAYNPFPKDIQTQDSTFKKRKKISGTPDKREEIEENRLTEAWIQTFEVVFGYLQGKVLIFVDENGQILKYAELKPTQFQKDPQGNWVEPKILNEKDNTGIKALIPKDDMSRNERINPEWLKKWRLYLKQQNPSMDLRLEERKELPRIFSMLAYIRDQNLQTTYLDHIYKQANQKIKSQHTNKEQTYTRLEYIQKVMSESSLPQELQDLLIGVCGLESGFSDNAKSNKKAVGAWQFIPLTAKAYGLIGKDPKTKKSFDHRNDFIASTHAAKEYFIYLYTLFLKNEDVKKLRDRFDLSEKDIIYPLVINAYNTGENNMLKVIRWFLEEYPTKEKFEKRFGTGPYGMDLYTCMAQEALEETDEPDLNQYGRNSRDYFLQVSAISRLLQEKLKNSSYRHNFDPKQAESELYPQDEREIEDVSFTPEEVQDAVKLGVRAIFGNFIGLGLEYYLNRLQERNKEIKDTIYLTRRSILKALGAASLGVAVSEYFSFQKSREKMETQLEKIMPAIENMKNKKAPTYKRLPEKANSEFVQWIETPAYSKIFPLLKDLEEVRYLAQQGKMKKLKKQTLHYRLTTVGEDTTHNKKDREDMYHVYPHMEILIQNIAEKINLRFQQLGWPSEFIIRPNINSLVRPQRNNKNLNNASSKSAHTYGLAIDFSIQRFDVLIDNQQYVQLKGGMPEANDIISLYQQILAGILRELYDQGEIFLNREYKPPHFHVIDKKADIGIQ